MLYVDKLDGRIDTDFFDRMSAEWRAEQDRCLRYIERHSAADQSYLEEGIRVLELAKDGELTVNLRQPFDLLADTSARTLDVEESDDADLARRAIWLGLTAWKPASATVAALLLLLVVAAQPARGSSHKCMHDSGMISPITRRPKDEE